MPKLNFFTPFLEENKATPQHSKVLVVLLVVFLAAGSYLGLQVWTNFLEKDVAAKEDQLDKVSDAKLTEVKEVMRLIAEHKNYQQMTDRIQEDIERNDFVKLKLMEKILENVPQNLFFQDLNLSRTEWSLLGFADSRLIIARFEYNLKNSGLVDNIAVENIGSSKIENQGEVFIFSMKGTFYQGVVEHEN